MTAKNQITQALRAHFSSVDFDVLVPPKLELGDYSINLAFALAKKEGKNPAEVAKQVLGDVQSVLPDGFKAELAGPYINIHFKESCLQEILIQIIEHPADYGKGTSKDKRVNLEFISANPTGPITVANARAGSYGDTLANVLTRAGYEVAKEYYINDVGNQVIKRAMSEVNAELEEAGKKPRYQEEGLYMGDYVIKGAHETAAAFSGSYKDMNLSDVKLEVVIEAGIRSKIKSFEKSVRGLGVHFDTWFRESSLHESGEVSEALEILKQKKAIFKKDGATWLRYGSSENEVAVLIKSDGATTYLMNDLAYTRNKLEKRKFDKAINIWGADHHGDVARLKGGVVILGFEPERLEILLHQMVTLRRSGQLVRMSKRAGNIETLDDLVAEVGKDAVRYFFLAKDLNTHMEFDIDLAKEQSKKNPVYYIQYAGARLASIFEKAGGNFDQSSFTHLRTIEELDLLRVMAKFPDIVEDVSLTYHVHRLAQYAYDLAGVFHKFYENHRVVQENPDFQSARIGLCLGAREVLKQCLDLMGIEMRERM